MVRVAGISIILLITAILSVKMQNLYQHGAKNIELENSALAKSLRFKRDTPRLFLPIYIFARQIMDRFSFSEQKEEIEQLQKECSVSNFLPMAIGPVMQLVSYQGIVAMQVSTNILASLNLATQVFAKRKELAQKQKEDEAEMHAALNAIQNKIEMCSAQLNTLTAKSCEFQQAKHSFHEVNKDLLLSKIKLGKAEAVEFCKQNCLQLANLDEQDGNLFSHSIAKDGSSRSFTYWSDSGAESKTSEVGKLTCVAVKFGKKKISSVDVPCSQPLRFVCAKPEEYTFSSHFLFDQVMLDIETEKNETEALVEKTPGLELLHREEIN